MNIPTHLYCLFSRKLANKLDETLSIPAYLFESSTEVGLLFNLLTKLIVYEIYTKCI